MKCTVYVIVLTVVGLAVQILAGGDINYNITIYCIKLSYCIQLYIFATDCEKGAVRFDPERFSQMRPHEGYIHFCFDNLWHKLCGEMFNRVEANVICKQLGYLGSEYINITVCIQADTIYSFY